MIIINNAEVRSHCQEYRGALYTVSSNVDKNKTKFRVKSVLRHRQFKKACLHTASEDTSDGASMTAGGRARAAVTGHAWSPNVERLVGQIIRVGESADRSPEVTAVAISRSQVIGEVYMRCHAMQTL